MLVWRQLGGMARLLSLVIASFALGFAISTAALAGHGNETGCKPAPSGGNYQQAILFESGGSYGRDGNRAIINRITPSPSVKTAIVRSIYLWGSSGIDMVEFGWVWAGDIDYVLPGITTEDSPIAFAGRLINGIFVASEGGPSNPGHGFVPLGDSYYRIERNVPGDTPSSYYFYRAGSLFGHYFNGNMPSGGRPEGGNEGFGPCEDMDAHFDGLDKQNSEGASWTDWPGVSRCCDFATKWWYTQKDDSPPEWWMKHCANQNCPNV